MSQYTYFMVSPSNVPSSPPYCVWYATWSAGSTSVTWSKTPPSGSTWIICRTTDDAPDVPDSSIKAWPAGIKDGDPPPLSISPSDSDTEFQAQFGISLDTRGSFDIYTYFLTSLAKLPDNPDYAKVWFAQWGAPSPKDPSRNQLTWSSIRPALTPDNAASWVLACVKNADAPSDKLAAWPNGIKDTDPPPSVVRQNDVSDFQMQYAPQRSLDFDELMNAPRV
jgi:hypothetical protein